MDTSALVSVEEYLRTSFPDGDREYVDGRIVERNIGEFDHSDVQSSILHYFRTHYKTLWAGGAVRVQVKRTRFRIPDVTVIVDLKLREQIIRTPPFLVIEVLSPDDRVGELQEKIDDYLSFGIPYVWIINPMMRRAYIHTSDGSHECKDGVMRTDNPGMEVPLAEVLPPVS